MSEKAKNWLSILFVLLTVAGAAYLIYPVSKSTKLGLDLRGGLYVVLEARPTKNNPITNDSMEQTIKILRDRIDRLGVAEPQIERYGTKNILIQLPGIKNPDDAIKIIQKPAFLEFKKVVSVDEKTGKVKTGETMLTGKDLSNARAAFTQTGAPQVELTFNAEGAKKFEEVTRSLSLFAKGTPQRRLAIVLDGKVISAPEVQGPISGGKAVITGLKSIDEAKEIALVLQSGALPIKLSIQQNRTVGATVGQDSLRAGIKAGVFGLVLVAVYLLVFYRVFALMTWASLLLFAGVIWGGLVAVGATLTLPGVAGAILMVGIAADSSIIILERIKDEIKSGRSMRLAVETGFSHGFQTFLDADLVTFVTALAIFFFGAGAIKGFALILIIGIFADLFTAYFFKRPVLGLMSTIKFLRPWMIGTKGVEKK